MSRPRLPEEDYQALFEFCLDFAVKCLQDQRGFLPFGEYIRPNGEHVPTMVDSGEQYPSPKESLDSLFQIFRTMAIEGNMRVCCVCADGTQADGITDQVTNVIIFDMEHDNWRPMRVIVPYKILSDGNVETGTAVETRLAPRIFLPTNSGAIR